jgi:hypothetical protein
MCVQVIVVGVVVLLAVVIFLLACFTGGKNCVSKGKGSEPSNSPPEWQGAPTPGAPAGGTSSLSPGEPVGTAEVPAGTPPAQGSGGTPTGGTSTLTPGKRLFLL